MDEFEIIRRFFTRDSEDKNVIVGIGDDGAVLRPDPGLDLVTVVDSLVAGVHFPRLLDAFAVGYRAVAVNLSDIAAMGGRPRWMTLALTLVESDPDWLGEFARGLFAAADRHHVVLVGGDTTRGSEIVVSVQITGDVRRGRALRRSGARAGDGIYVTGTPGDASAGLSVIQSGAPHSDDVDYLVRRFTRPDARVEAGQAIAPHASAAIDLSDGLFTDLEKLLSASNAAGCIELNDIPFSSALSQLMAREDALKFALGGGDDYELCFTASDDSIQAITAKVDLPVTRIGRVARGSGLTCTMDGQPYDYRDEGYRHFR